MTIHCIAGTDWLTWPWDSLNGILDLPGPRRPSTCISHAVLTAPLESITCPYQQSLLSHKWGQGPQAQASTVAVLACGHIPWPNTADPSDHGPSAILQTLKVWLGQLPSFTCMEHHVPHARAVHMAIGLERSISEIQDFIFICGNAKI